MLIRVCWGLSWPKVIQFDTANRHRSVGHPECWYFARPPTPPSFSSHLAWPGRAFGPGRRQHMGPIAQLKKPKRGMGRWGSSVFDRECLPEGRWVSCLRSPLLVEPCGSSPPMRAGHSPHPPEATSESACLTEFLPLTAAVTYFCDEARSAHLRRSSLLRCTPKAVELASCTPRSTSASRRESRSVRG